MSKQFVCTCCHCVDHVDLVYPVHFPEDVSQQLCSECKTGTWHGLFEKKLYNPDRDYVINGPTGIGLG